MKLTYLERAYVNGVIRHRIQRPLEFRLFGRMAPIPQRAHILEIGCGNGGGLAYLAAHYNPASLTGIDLDPAQIQAARQKLATLSITSLHVGSAAQVPLPAHSYDVIICAGVLHHMPEWRKAVAECARLLRHGGMLYILEFYHPFLNLPVLRQLFPHPVTGLTRITLKADLSHHGFSTLGSVPSPNNRFKRWLANHVNLTATRLAITQPEYD